MQKLTVVVNCTERKSVKPVHDLQARHLPVDGEESRFESWGQRVRNSTELVPLTKLYQGEAWVQAKGLITDAHASGMSVRSLVASAGLGLRNLSGGGPSYAATFATGHADSVTLDANASNRWWTRLKALPRVTSLSQFADGPILLVLSENYARAMDHDLNHLATRGGDYLLVGGCRTVAGLNRLPADRELRHSLGGTVSTVSLRMARRWMQTRSGKTLSSELDFQNWSAWARDARRSESYQRVPETDAELIMRIKSMINEERGLSATRALRKLRDTGVACEQKRFGALFREVAGES